jgi:hypothetical protein
MAGAHLIGLARLAKLLQCILTDGFQQPVTRWARGVLGDDE